MTQEEKQLLLKDLCARLPYGVKFAKGNVIYPLTGINIALGYVELAVSERISIEEAKPYLRPMSSITEEEKEELNELTNGIICFNNYGNISTTVCHKGNPHYWCTELGDWIKVIDFLLRKHFDIFGFIGKGLALDALEGMYN